MRTGRLALPLVLPLAAALTLGACTTTVAETLPEPPGPPLAWASVGEKVYFDGPQVTPLALLEDSRCPLIAQCVWAGRVRVRATVHLGTGDRTYEMTLNEPIGVADGSLELVAVRPEKGEAAVPPEDYRFGFRFMGGL